jgi:hypothetical protein
VARLHHADGDGAAVADHAEEWPHGQRHLKRAHTGQILVKYRSNTGQTRAAPPESTPRLRIARRD